MIALTGAAKKDFLAAAAYRGDQDKVKLLIANGADIDAADKCKNTPLSLSVNKGYEKIVEVLIDNGADINQVNKHGRTPLLDAAHKGHENIVKLLIAKGADIDKADKSGRTPLLAAANNGYEDIVEVLISNKANIHKADTCGRTPLSVAVNQGHKNIAELLNGKKKSFIPKELYEVMRQVESISPKIKCFLVGSTMHHLVGEIDWDKLNDIDLVTNATKEQLTTLPNKLLTETTNQQKNQYIVTELNIPERTTLIRCEMSYKHFLDDNCNTDSLDRDVTINAIYMDKEGKIFDPHNGKQDLQQKLISLIGNPKNNLSCRPYNFLRCLYVKAKHHDFDFKPDTLQALHDLADRIVKGQDIINLMPRHQRLSFFTYLPKKPLIMDNFCSYLQQQPKLQQAIMSIIDQTLDSCTYSEINYHASLWKFKRKINGEEDKVDKKDPIDAMSLSSYAGYTPLSNSVCGASSSLKLLQPPTQPSELSPRFGC
jgi:ribosomal protein S6